MEDGNGEPVFSFNFTGTEDEAIRASTNVEQAVDDGTVFTVDMVMTAIHEFEAQPIE